MSIKGRVQLSCAVQTNLSFRLSSRRGQTSACATNTAAAIYLPRAVTFPLISKEGYSSSLAEACVAILAFSFFSSHFVRRKWLRRMACHFADNAVDLAPSRGKRREPNERVHVASLRAARSRQVPLFRVSTSFELRRPRMQRNTRIESMPRAERQKYYAVRRGREGPKVYESWEEVSSTRRKPCRNCLKLTLSRRNSMSVYNKMANGTSLTAIRV